MSMIDIQQPYLTGGIRSVNFFNGRLLSGEDLSREQDANRESHRRLGLAIGTGIVAGLEVLAQIDNSNSSSLAVTVQQGMAINALGQTLTLTEDVTLSLSSTSSIPNNPQTGTFSNFNLQTAPIQLYQTPPAGVYLLTLAPTIAKEGFSPVAGFHNSVSFSANGYLVDGLQFRLFPLPVDGPLTDNHLRNKLAYACFGFSDTTPSFNTPTSQRQRLLDTLKPPLTEDVPLALLCWTDNQQFVFIDGWSVRRRITQQTYPAPWLDLLSDQRLSEAEAMLLQFQNQTTSILQSINANNVSATNQQSSIDSGAISATQFFSYLPPAGYLPVGDNGFNWQIFLGTLAPQRLATIDEHLQRLILHNALFAEPIKIGPFEDNTPSNEAPISVFQLASYPEYVFFARPTTGQLKINVEGQGFQTSSTTLSFTLGQQSTLSLPLQSEHALVQTRPLFLDIEKIERPVLSKIRLSLVQQPLTSSATLSAKMLKVDPLPANIAAWLSSWQDWLNGQYPNQGIDLATPALFIDDYYAPPKKGRIPSQPSAYVVFGDTMLPLLLTISYYVNPLPVPLARANIRGLTAKNIQALTAIGLNNIDQLVGAWTTLIAETTGESLDYSQYLISDAIQAVENINATRSYYEGLDAEVAEILEQMALSDDVALANADPDELGEQLNSTGFALRLISQAQQAVPVEHWSLASLKLSDQQVLSLQKLHISSKGILLRRAETGKGRQQLERALGINKQALDELHTNTFAQITASSFALARIKDMVLLPNVDAVIANRLAEADIASVQTLAHTDKQALIEITGMSEDAAEDLKHEAKDANTDGLEVVRLASVTKEVADALNDVLGVKTIEHLNKQTEEKVVEVFKRFHGDRAVHFVQALFDGIQGADK